MGIKEIDENVCAIDNEQKENKQTKGLCNAIIFHKFQKMKWEILHNKQIPFDECVY